MKVETPLTHEAVGSQADAQAACDGTLREIGRGAFRTAYIDARKRVIYKVERSGYANQNAQEHAAAEMLREHGQPWAPPSTLWTVNGHDIIAMPYYPLSAHQSPPKTRKQLRDAQAACLRITGRPISDMHDGNWRATKRGNLKITDIGFGL